MKHEAEDASYEPDWDIPLTVTVTAASVIDTVFATAFSVHTGTESCINPELAVVDIVAPDDNGGNFSRYVEQEYGEDSDPEALWHDWTVELKIGATFVVGHWWTRASGSPADWEWCAKEAEHGVPRGGPVRRQAGAEGPRRRAYRLVLGARPARPPLNLAPAAPGVEPTWRRGVRAPKTSSAAC